jgi:hypothetical protein
MTDFVDLDFDVGPWGTPARGPEKDLQDLAQNLDLVRSCFKSSLPVSEENIIRGMIWVNAASSTWIVNLSDGNDWIELLSIDTLTSVITYPGGFIAGDSLPDGTLNTYHVKDGELTTETLADQALREIHPSSGTLIRSHVSSGAIREINLKSKIMSRPKFSPNAVSGDKIDLQTISRGNTGTSYEFREFTFGVPDIKGGYIHGKTSQCFWDYSQTGMTGFKLKSSTQTFFQIQSYEHKSF